MIYFGWNLVIDCLFKLCFDYLIIWWGGFMLNYVIGSILVGYMELNLIEFVWIELINWCNFNCSYCYVELGLYFGDLDIFEVDDYVCIFEELFELGCK